VSVTPEAVRFSARFNTAWYSIIRGTERSRSKPFSSAARSNLHEAPRLLRIAATRMCRERNETAHRDDIADNIFAKRQQGNPGTDEGIRDGNPETVRRGVFYILFVNSLPTVYPKMGTAHPRSP